MKKLLLSLSLGLMTASSVSAITNQEATKITQQQAIPDGNRVDVSKDDVFQVIYLLRINHETLADWLQANDKVNDIRAYIITSLKNQFGFAYNLPDKPIFIITNLANIMAQIFVDGTQPYTGNEHIGLPTQDIRTYDKGNGVRVHIPKWRNTFFADDTSAEGQ